MARHYDAATRDLIELDPSSFLKYLGFQVQGPVSVKNCDLSTVVAETDSIVLVEENPPWLVHVEFQSTSESDLDLRIDRYNLMVEYRERLPVISVVMLMRPEADSSRLTGSRIRIAPDQTTYREFRYHVIRVWEQSVEAILNGPLPLLPLAVLAKVPEGQVAPVIERIEERFSVEPDETLVAQLRADAMILMGLRFSSSLINASPWRTEKMRESSYYQAILQEGREEGREEGALSILLRIGTHKLGTPSHEMASLLHNIHDLDRIGQLTERVWEVKSWQELLQG